MFTAIDIDRNNQVLNTDLVKHLQLLYNVIFLFEIQRVLLGVVLLASSQLSSQFLGSHVQVQAGVLTVHHTGIHV